VRARVTPQDVSAYEWWPGCEGASTSTSHGSTEDITNCWKETDSGSEGSQCCQCHEREGFRAYTSTTAFKEVTFTSREGDSDQKTVNISAWWLPAHPSVDEDAAIIVVHGAHGTKNDFRAALASYLVRTSGFSVLLLSLRGHGSSDSAEDGKMTWGWDYPYDVLGAWDYLVNDTDGELGGKRNPSKIGIMGFSLGGFVAASAFGLEHDAAALWIDGAASHPRDIMKVFVSKYVPAPLDAIVNVFAVPPAYVLTEQLSGVDLDHHSPEKTLPTGPETRRAVMVVQNLDDADAPMWMALWYERLFTKYDTRYALETWFDAGGSCTMNRGTSGERVETHNMLQWLHPATYRVLLCQFFSEHLLKKNCDFSIIPVKMENVASEIYA
jgi:pimeloyl-ACP methyl ester carboxylesterase